MITGKYLPLCIPRNCPTHIIRVKKNSNEQNEITSPLLQEFHCASHCRSRKSTVKKFGVERHCPSSLRRRPRRRRMWFLVHRGPHTGVHLLFFQEAVLEQVCSNSQLRMEQGNDMGLVAQVFACCSVGLCRGDPSSRRIACKKKECHSVGLHPDIAQSVVGGGIGNNVPGLSTSDSGRS